MGPHASPAPVTTPTRTSLERLQILLEAMAAPPETFRARDISVRLADPHFESDPRSLYVLTQKHDLSGLGQCTIPWETVVQFARDGSIVDGFTSMMRPSGVRDEIRGDSDRTHKVVDELLDAVATMLAAVRARSGDLTGHCLPSVPSGEGVARTTVRP